jgi:hypothetical protein
MATARFAVLCIVFASGAFASLAFASLAFASLSLLRLSQSFALVLFEA